MSTKNLFETFIATINYHWSFDAGQKVQAAIQTRDIAPLIAYANSCTEILTAGKVNGPLHLEALQDEIEFMSDAAEWISDLPSPEPAAPSLPDYQTWCRMKGWTIL